MVLLKEDNWKVVTYSDSKEFAELEHRCNNKSYWVWWPIESFAKCAKCGQDVPDEIKTLVSLFNIDKQSPPAGSIRFMSYEWDKTFSAIYKKKL